MCGKRAIFTDKKCEGNVANNSDGTRTFDSEFQNDTSVKVLLDDNTKKNINNLYEITHAISVIVALNNTIDTQDNGKNNVHLNPLRQYICRVKTYYNEIKKDQLIKNIKLNGTTIIQNIENIKKLLAMNYTKIKNPSPVVTYNYIQFYLDKNKNELIESE